jgi:hypothetical protein
MANLIERKSLLSPPRATTPTENHMLEANDIRDLYTDTDTLFVVTVISDAMRRGVKHFRLDGRPLGRLNDVVDALAEDGEVLMDMDGSEDDPRH